jgi:Mrp family chromosome partitioning ATPase
LFSAGAVESSPGEAGTVVTYGGSLPVRDVDVASGRALTVAELQQALRAARAAAIESPGRSRRLAMVEQAPIGDVPPTWTERDIYVVGVHAGAGTSTVALALADVAANAGPVHLVERCRAGCSGLASAADIELGDLPDGGWRRGRRGLVVVDRPITDAEPNRRRRPPAN